MALMNQACSYRHAAELLSSHLSAHIADKPSIEYPLYFLCVHATELALKSFLISRGGKIFGENQTHLLSRLLGKCYRAGLHAHPRGDWTNLCNGLDKGNEEHNFRYINAYKGGGGIAPEWAVELTAAFVASVDSIVRPLYAHEPLGPATKLQLRFGKPIPWSA